MAARISNTVDTAYARLRDRLVTFDVKPGARLNESEIAAGMSMSRAPVREALNRLIADGLVSFEPGRGFFCRKLSVTEISDLYQVRLDLETGALRAVLDSVADDTLDAFCDKWRSDLAQSGHRDIPDLVAADEAFHLDLAGLAGNASRLKFLQNINDRIRFVRRINLEVPGRYEAALSEHARLIDAVAARNADRAADTLRDHLARSTEEVRAQVQAALARIYADDVA